MRITVSKSNVFNEYGQLQAIGTTFVTSDAYGAALVQSQQGTDADALVTPAARRPYDTVPVVETTTPRVSISSGGLAAIRDLLPKLSIKLNPKSPVVMTSPPTVAYTDATGSIVAPLIASGREWAAVFDNATLGVTPSISLSHLRIHGAGRMVAAGTTSPLWTMAKPNCVTRQVAPPTASRYVASMTHRGRYLAFQTRNNNPIFIYIKVNGEYVSLTPTSYTTGASPIPSANAAAYVSIDFGSRAKRRVEFLTYNCALGSIYTEASDTLSPAGTNGPRMIKLGDSWVDATGATNGAMGFVTSFGDSIGWDDVWQSGSGGTGYIANNGATELTYRQRLATDVIPFAPDIVAFFGSLNDNSFTYQQLYTEMLLTYQTLLAALPNVLIVVIPDQCSAGPGVLSGGAGASGVAGAGLNNLNAARAAAAAVGALCFTPFEMSLSDSITPYTTTLTAIAAGVTTITTAGPLQKGATYKFANGAKFECRTSSGIPATVTTDGPITQANGATLTLCGNSYLTGNGKVGAAGSVPGSADELMNLDGTPHPSPLGHDVLGAVLADEFAIALRRALN